MAPPTKGSRKRPSSLDAHEDYESDNGFVADVPTSKKAKTATVRDPPKPSSTAKSGTKSNGEDAEFWEITATRRVTIDEFKGNRMVNIREYYQDKSTGAMLPGRKGISLPLAQYSTLLTLLPGIEVALRAKGETIPRPDYGAVKPAADAQTGGAEEEDDLDNDNGENGKKKNFEATSEEDG